MGKAPLLVVPRQGDIFTGDRNVYTDGNRQKVRHHLLLEQGKKCFVRNTKTMEHGK